MTKKLEINFTKKPEIVFQFDQFLNVEQAVDKFLNKKENLKKLIAPLIPTNLEETIQKLIPEVSDGYTPQKGVDYDDGKDGETPSDEKIISLIKPQIPKVIPWKDGTTPKKGIDYFTKKELDEIKKELKTTILSEMPEHATKEEVNIKITEVLDKIRKLPTWGGGAQFLRQLMDVNVWTPTAQQYGLTYNPSRGEFALTAITWGGGAVDSVNWQTGVVVLDQDDVGDGTTYKQYSATEKTKLAGIETGAEVNTIDTVSDTTEIDLAITARDLTATIRAGSIDESKLDTSVNASLDLADSAVQDLSDLWITATASEINVLDWITASTAELNYTDGVTSSIQTQIDGKQASLGFTPENVANKGIAWGYASLDGTGKVPASQLPAYVDDIIEVANFASLPVTGVTGVLYVTLDTNLVYRWTGSIYVEISPSSGGAWGTITGTLSDQTDLQTALDGKVDENWAITGATKTKITYDAKGLVTSGADATTADIADSTNRRYVTDAQLTVISNTSGTNTGDQTSVTGNAWTATALQTARTIGTATGDVTSAGSSFDGTANNTNAYTIASSAVTLAKMADLAQDQFIGRTTASTWVPQTATITAAARTVLDDTTVGAMVDTLGGATSTGTGWLVRATSPTLVTPALGTPSALVGTNITGTATGLTSGITNALKSATTTVDVSAATAPSSGQVLTATSSTAATWQTPSGWAPKTKFSTTFEAISRFTTGTAGTGATPTVDTAWLNLRTSTNWAANVIWAIRNGEYQSMSSLQMSMRANAVDTGNSSGKWDFFFWLWNFAMTIAAAGITFTNKHIGVKIIKNLSDTYDIIGTQADGSTEAVTSTIATMTSWQTVDIIIDVTSTTNTNFYVSVNYGAYATASLGSTNRPSWDVCYPIIWVSSHWSNSSQRYWWDIIGANFEH